MRNALPPKWIKPQWLETVSDESNSTGEAITLKRILRPLAFFLA